jgi:hypothetical protein
MQNAAVSLFKTLNLSADYSEAEQTVPPPLHFSFAMKTLNADSNAFSWIEALTR